MTSEAGAAPPRKLGSLAGAGAGTWSLKAGSAARTVSVHAAVLIGYLAAGIAVNWTRAAYLTDHVLPTGRDSGLFVWDFWWIARSVAHFSNPWFTYYQAAPVGAPLGLHVLMPLPGLLMTPVTLVYGPSFTYNLLAAVAPGLMCYAMYRAARLWVPSQTGAIAAGAFFGLSTMMTWDSWVEIQLALGAIFLPLTLEAAVRLRRRPGWRQAAILGVVLGAALLTDQESAIMAAALAAAALLPWLARRPANGGDPAWVKLRSAALAAGVAAAVASPQLIAMAAQALAGQASVSQVSLASDYQNSGASLLQIFEPSPRVAFFGLESVAALYHRSGPQSLTVTAYGVVLTALALFGLGVCWRRRNARLLALFWLGSTWLALGTGIVIGSHRYVPLAQAWHDIQVSVIMPYTWMVRISLLSSFREADRITELGLVPAALLAAVAVNWLRYHAKPVLIVVFALAILEAGSVGAGIIPLVTIPTALPALDRPIAADHSGSIVVDVPLGVRSAVPLPQEGAAFNPEAQVLATADGHPRSVAYVSRLPVSTLAAVKRHPFYGDLLMAQRAPGILYARLLAGKTDRARIMAARLDACRMNVRWAIVWSSTPVILHYLQAVGLRFDYRADGALVYRMTLAGGPARPRCPR